jgi:hypothetical protein
MSKRTVKHQAPSRGKRLAGGFLLSAAASAAIATVTMGTAPEAKATCVSFGGVVNTDSSHCQTTSIGDVAIAIGPGTYANASGGFNTSISLGPNAQSVAEGQLNAGHGFNTAIAVGSNAVSSADTGLANTSISIGNNPDTTCCRAWTGGRGNLAVNVGQGSSAEALGDFNRAISFGNGSKTYAYGLGAGVSRAISLGNNNNTTAGGPFSATNRGFAASIGNGRLSFNGINKVNP